MRIPDLNLIVAFVLAGLIAMGAGVIFGVPSLRIKGLYLAVATLAAQFFSDWLFTRVKWLSNDSTSGSVQVPALEMFGQPRHPGPQVPVRAGDRLRVRADGQEPGARSPRPLLDGDP